MKKLILQDSGHIFTITSNDPDFIFDAKNLVSIEEVVVEKSKPQKLSKNHIKLKEYIVNQNIDLLQEKK